jgi:hypothetical protein
MMTALPPFAPHVRSGIAAAVLLTGLVGPAVGRDLLPNGNLMISSSTVTATTRIVPAKVYINPRSR